MKVHFLGTNGWYDTKTGNTVCVLIEADDYYILLDAGNGIYKADRYIKKNKPVYLFLSHFHLDHIIGLHILVKFKFKSLTIYGQKGSRSILTNFLGPKFSFPIKRLPYPCRIKELKPGWHNRPFKFRALKLKHASSCFGYRLEIDNKVISFCTDTGYCDEAIELSRDADLLISECAYLSGQENKSWPHLNPELAARLAQEAGAKRMALMHFDAHAYKDLSARKNAENKAKKIFKNTFSAKDNITVKV
jgi:ribonuclease BN (tRNA processing enzyme)